MGEWVDVLFRGDVQRILVIITMETIVTASVSYQSDPNWTSCLYDH